MNNIPEIKVELETKIVGKKPEQYDIDDMIQMFGKRIKNAIHSDENGYNALITKKIARITKRWKFWNSDIRKAYQNYFGMLLVPYIIAQTAPTICCGIDVDNEVLNKMITKEISSRYKATEINPDFYKTLNNIKFK